MRAKKKPIAKLRASEKIIGKAVKPSEMNPYYATTNKPKKNGKAKK